MINRSSPLFLLGGQLPVTKNETPAFTSTWLLPETEQHAAFPELLHVSAVPKKMGPLFTQGLSKYGGSGDTDLMKNVSLSQQEN